MSDRRDDMFRVKMEIGKLGGVAVASSQAVTVEAEGADEGRSRR